MFWNGLETLYNGQPADGVIGDEFEVGERTYCCGRTKVDAADRLWVLGFEGRYFLDVYQLPLNEDSAPLHTIWKELASFPVLGTTERISLGGRVFGIAPEGDGDLLWLSDTDSHRVLRIRKPLIDSVVDVVLGQRDTTGALCNQQMIGARSGMVDTGMCCVTRGHCPSTGWVISMSPTIRWKLKAINVCWSFRDLRPLPRTPRPSLLGMQIRYSFSRPEPQVIFPRVPVEEEEAMRSGVFSNGGRMAPYGSWRVAIRLRRSLPLGPRPLRFPTRPATPTSLARPHRGSSTPFTYRSERYTATELSEGSAKDMRGAAGKEVSLPCEKTSGTCALRVLRSLFRQQPC